MNGLCFLCVRDTLAWFFSFLHMFGEGGGLGGGVDMFWGVY